MESSNPYAVSQSTVDAPVLAAVVMDEHGTTIDYENTLQDLLDFAVYHYWHSPSVRRTLVLGWVVTAVLMLVATGILVGTVEADERWAAGLIAGIPCMLLWLALPWLYFAAIRSSTSRMYRESAGSNLNLIGPRRLTLSGDLLNYSTPISQMLNRWSGVERIAVDREAFYIYLSSVLAIVVPRRAFGSDAEFRAFAQLASTYREASLPGSSEQPAPRR
jgi:hypothetical protein